MDMSLYRLLSGAATYLGRRSHLEFVNTHTIYTLDLGPESIIVDLGANNGEFSHVLRSRFDCRCYAVEAMPGTFERIDTDPKLAKFNVAISDQDAPVRMFESENHEASSIFPSIADEFGLKSSLDVEGKTLQTFLRDQALETVDILKVDIEGAERNLFASTSDETLGRMKQITIEFHDFFPDSITTREVDEIRRRLERLGFLCIPASFIHPHMKHMDLLFVNKKQARLPLKDRMALTVVSLLLKTEGLKSKLRRTEVTSDRLAR